MTESPSPAAVGSPAGTGPAIFWTGLLAGTLDMTAAITYFLISGGTDPTRILWYIASAVLGHDAAFSGGWLTAATGLLMHYLIAYSFTVLFFALYPRVPALGRRPVAAGIAYGAFAWVLMNLVVVPLTRIGKFPATLKGAVINMVILMVCIGLPISLRAHRHFTRR